MQADHNEQQRVDTFQKIIQTLEIFSLKSSWSGTMTTSHKLLKIPILQYLFFFQGSHQLLFSSLYLPFFFILIIFLIELKERTANFFHCVLYVCNPLENTGLAKKTFMLLCQNESFLFVILIEAVTR